MQSVSTVLVICVATVLFLPSPPPGQRRPRGEHEDDSAVRGRYFNAKYGYSVEVPKGLTAYRMLAPAPQHGIAIHGAADPADEIWVNGEYDAAGEGSAEAVAAATADYFRKTYHLEAISNSKAVLSGLNARDVVLRRRHSTRRREVSCVHLRVAYRFRTSGVPIVYTIGLRKAATESQLDGAFSEVMRSFRNEAPAE